MGNRQAVNQAKEMGKYLKNNQIKFSNVNNLNANIQNIKQIKNYKYNTTLKAGQG